MKRFITAQQSHNQELTLRRSTRLTDKFQKLPDELTTKIFSKLEDEPKTLIRCTAVCKNWASFVSETVNLSLRFSSLGNEGLSIPCSKLHYHIPQSAIPSIMNVFANLESFEIKLCNYASQLHIHLIVKTSPRWRSSGMVMSTKPFVSCYIICLHLFQVMIMKLRNWN